MELFGEGTAAALCDPLWKVRHCEGCAVVE